MNGPVLRTPGLPLVLAMTFLSFSGYAALLPVAPLWAVHGGAGSVGAGLVNGVLMLFTVLTQLVIPNALRRFGWSPVLVAGTLLLGLPSVAFALSDALLPVLALSAIRGLGFGVVTVTGSALVAELVPPARRGEAIGLYGLAIAAPQVLFVSAGPWLVENLGFGLIFALGMLPAIGVAPALIMGRRAGPVPATQGRAAYLRLLQPMALLLAVTLAGGALITFMAPMSDSAALSTLALLCMMLATAVTRWQAGRWSDAFGPHRFLGPLVLVSVVGMAALAWAVRLTAGHRSRLAPARRDAQWASATALCRTSPWCSHSSPSAAPTTARPAHSGTSGTTGRTRLGAVMIGAIAAGSSYSVALLIGGALCLLTLPLTLIRPAPSTVGLIQAASALRRALDSTPAARSPSGRTALADGSSRSIAPGQALPFAYPDRVPAHRALERRTLLLRRIDPEVGDGSHT